MIPRRILVPIELGDDFVAARELAVTLAGALNAELVLLGIATEPVAPVAAGTLDMPVPPVPIVADDERMIDRLVQERLDEALDALPPRVRARSVLTWGPAGSAVIDAVEEQRADLVVLSTRRETAIEHILGDHMQRHVLNHSPVPVLVVPAAA
jgi:nucleotide-binding universal stress UspA family protein